MSIESYSVVVPARMHSTRLPNKLLLQLADKPIIQHVVEQCQKTSASQVVVATDHQDIFDAVSSFSGVAVMTSDKHQSGTDRLAEAAEKLGLDDEHIIINVQGDEPEIPPTVIEQLAKEMSESNAPVATLITPICDSSQIHDPNVVKVVRDESGRAIYFSRAPIPFDRDDNLTKEGKEQIGISDVYYRHIGIYAYRVKALKAFTSWQPSILESIEKLEQLRFLEKGHAIQAAVACEVPPIGIDTEEDYLEAKQRMEA